MGEEYWVMWIVSYISYIIPLIYGLLVYKERGDKKAGKEE